MGSTGLDGVSAPFTRANLLLDGFHWFGWGINVPCTKVSPSDFLPKRGRLRQGEVLRVTDFQGAWVRLAPDTEAQAGGVASAGPWFAAVSRWVWVKMSQNENQDMDRRFGCMFPFARAILGTNFRPPGFSWFPANTP